MATQTLGDRALNRALLERQLLLERRDLSVPAAVEHLVGMQAQEPRDPYVGLWSRLAGFDPDVLGRALLDRELVRIALQRSTIHLVTARDCLALRPVLDEVGVRMVRGQFGRRLAGVDLDELAAAARELVEAGPLTFGELGKRLAARWPDRDPLALGQTARTRVPLVQLPPRGVWGRGGRAVHATVETWLGEPPGPDRSPDGLVLRYLGAFGPASVLDAQNWSGLTRLREVFERLAPRLRTFAAGDGRTLYDLPDAPRPDAEVPAPVRFLPQYDNVLLGHADRSRMVAPESAVLWDEDFHWAPVLVDGMVRGTWRLAAERSSATLHARFLGRLSTRDDRAVTAEATALLALLAPDAVERSVRVGTVSR